MRIGTRASALALAQARGVADAIGAQAELVPITTTGDRDRAALDKERWTRELDAALLSGEIDLAVHSAKDVPYALPDGVVHHTYSAYARGLDATWAMYQWLDRAPLGRNETDLWFRRRDEY